MDPWPSAHMWWSMEWALMALGLGEQGLAALVASLIHEIRIPLPSWRNTGNGGASRLKVTQPVCAAAEESEGGCPVPVILPQSPQRWVGWGLQGRVGTAGQGGPQVGRCRVSTPGFQAVY